MPRIDVYLLTIPPMCDWDYLRHGSGSLSIEEITRASQYTDRRSCHEFTFTRAALRQLLSYHCGCSPLELVFHYGEYGKPMMVCPRPVQISFNVTHASGHCAIAIADGQEIGVDMEQFQPKFNWRHEIGIALDPLEILAIEDLQFTRGAVAFWYHWVRREAYLKCKGVGLACPDTVFISGPIDSKTGGTAHGFAGGKPLGKQFLLEWMTPNGYIICLAYSKLSQVSISWSPFSVITPADF